MRTGLILCLLEIASRIGTKPFDPSSAAAVFLLVVLVICLMQDLRELYK